MGAYWCCLFIIHFPAFLQAGMVNDAHWVVSPYCDSGKALEGAPKVVVKFTSRIWLLYHAVSPSSLLKCILSSIGEETRRQKSVRHWVVTQEKLTFSSCLGLPVDFLFIFSCCASLIMWIAHLKWCSKFAVLSVFIFSCEKGYVM